MAGVVVASKGRRLPLHWHSGSVCGGSRLGIVAGGVRATSSREQGGDVRERSAVLPESNSTAETVLHVEGDAKLGGHVAVSGAKNSALPVLAASLLCQGSVEIINAPRLRDVEVMTDVLRSLGVRIERDTSSSMASTMQPSLHIDCGEVINTSPSPALVGKMRASFLVLGPLLARFGQASVPLPGGCNIGARPVDLHIRGLRALGADVEVREGCVHAKVKTKGGRLRGERIYLDYPSVGATETIMMAAALADGDTTIENVAQEPEVVDLAEFLKAMGVQVTGAGSNTIWIRGVRVLQPTCFTIIPDRIEAATFLILGAITQSTLSLSPIVPRHLTAVTTKLQAIGCQLSEQGPDRMLIEPRNDPSSGKKRMMMVATDVKTLPYPGFPTDAQAQLTALLCTCKGASVVRETVFEDRLRHVPELVSMGADIRVSEKESAAIIQGVPKLHAPKDNAIVHGSDLRGTASLILAALAAEGTTRVGGIHHLDRGYDLFDDKVRRLGGDITRCS